MALRLFLRYLMVSLKLVDRPKHVAEVIINVYHIYWLYYLTTPLILR